MTYLLDTNACIAAINARPRIVVERLANVVADNVTVAVSTVTLFELWYGIAKSIQVERNIETLKAFMAPLQILPFDEDDARFAGDIRAALERKGTPIGPYDLLIAAQALHHGLILVTANEREFARVRELRCKNWLA